MTPGEPDVPWTTAPVPTFLPIWWAMFIAHGVVGTLSAVTKSHGGPAQLAAGVFYLVAALCLVPVLQQIAHRQEASARKLSL